MRKHIRKLQLEQQLALTETLNFLQTNRNKTYLFYPSAGMEESEYLNTPYDYVILSDYGRANYIHGKVISLGMDNNQALSLIYQAGIKIHCFLGRVCGFYEGGAYESNNSLDFLGRLLPVLKDEFLYITSSKGRSEGGKNFTEGPVQLIKDFPDPDFLSDIPNKRYPIDRYIVQKLRKVHYSPKVILIGNRSLRLQRKSIWEDIQQLDGLFTSVYERRAMESFLAPSWKKKHRFIQEYLREKDPTPLLREANKNKWETIGLVPYGRDDYQPLIEAILNWKEPYPKNIHLYHLEKNDYRSIYGLPTEPMELEVFPMEKYQSCPACRGEGCRNCQGFGFLTPHGKYDDFD